MIKEREKVISLCQNIIKEYATIFLTLQTLNLYPNESRLLTSSGAPSGKALNVG